MSSSMLIVCVLFSVFVASDALFFRRSQRQQAQGLISEDCIEKAERGDCLFYICFDQRHPCDYDNYALRYGWRYCDRTENNYRRLTRQAQSWVNNTRVCAMTKMLEFYRASHVNCGDVEDEMQDNHAECEAENGVCDGDLLMENKDVLTDIYTFEGKVVMKFIGMVRECGKTSATEFLRWFGRQGKTALSFFRSLPDRLSGLQDDIAALRESLPRLSLPDLDFDTSVITDHLPEMEKK